MRYSTITLRSAGGRTEADFVPEANLLCCSLRHDGEEWLDQGQGVQAYAERGKTMGIPLLHPWANRLERFGYEVAGTAVALPEGDPRIPQDPAGLPIHGVIPGLLRWKLDPQPDHTSLTASLAWNSPKLLELFPFAHRLSAEMTLSEGELTIATTLRATGDAQVPVSFGYHPYFRLPGSDRNAWRMRLAAFRRLVLDQRMIPTGERQPVSRRRTRLGHASWDDGFDGLETPAEFQVTGPAARLTAAFLYGYAFAQVYAPPGHDYVCFEPMTAPTNALNSGDGLQLVEPGEEYRAAFTVRIAV